MGFPGMAQAASRALLLNIGKIDENLKMLSRFPKKWVKPSGKGEQPPSTMGRVCPDKVPGALQGSLAEGDEEISRAQNAWGESLLLNM